MSATRLECLSLWGIDIAFNSIGLVEVYLGDLGRRLPSDEWGHWLTHNVPPEGTMDEGRFRRDFLNQPAPTDDPARDLRQAREHAAVASGRVLGAPIWRTLEGDIAAEFGNLLGPLSSDPSALAHPILIVTKVLVDAIDPRPLKEFLGDAGPNERSLSLLKRALERMGDGIDTTAPLRDLQAFRSAGGVAHLAGSGKDSVTARLGISGLDPWPAFDRVTRLLTDCLRSITDLLESQSSEPAP